MEMVEYASTHGKHKISKDILLDAISKNMKVCAYEFEGYRRKIDSVQSYYGFNLDLLRKEVRDELFGLKNDRLIFTKIKDTVPTKYSKTAEIENSFIADGCKMVENVIFDKGVILRSGKKLVGQDTYPMVIGKEIVV